MSIKKSHKRWLIAFILIVLIVFVVEWLVSRNRAKNDRQEKDTIENNAK
jgi:hypothetical protein